MYTVPNGSELRLRIKAQKAGKITICLVPITRSFPEKFYTVTDLPVSMSWREITIPENNLSTFIISKYRGKGIVLRPYGNGVKIKHVLIFGNSTGELYLDSIAITGELPNSTN